MIRELEREWKNIIFNIVFAILTILFVVLLKDKITLATILLLIITITGMIKWKSKVTLILFVLGAIFGTLAEIIAVNYGVWSYTLNNFFDVPLWLFVVWGNAAAFLYQTGLEIKRLGVKK